jgi:Skp family chaperone for outer membrane proteins
LRGIYLLSFNDFQAEMERIQSNLKKIEEEVRAKERKDKDEKNGKDRYV